MPVWSGLGYVQKKAARALGWRKGTWDNYFLFQRDNNKKLYGTVAKYAQPWKKLSASDLKAARRLGFTERIWRQHDIFDRGGKKCAMPWPCFEAHLAEHRGCPFS